MISFILSIRQPVRFLLVIVYVSCVAALSLFPPDDLPHVEVFSGFDKLVHFTMYFVFSILFCWAVKAESNYLRLFYIVAVTAGWGILMEYMQLSMHNGRSFSWYDALANCVGITFGILTYILASRKWNS